jgi:dipeptidyl aminopeptidase/acylaminoacyl peptidase
METTPLSPLRPEQLLTIARAYLPVPSSGAGLYFASDMAGLSQVYRLDGPDRFPVRLAPSQDRTLPVAETPLGLLVRQDRGGDEVWQLGLIDEKGILRRLTRDGRAIHRDVKVSPDGLRAGLAYNPEGQSDWVLGEIDLETGETKQWLDGGGYWTWLGWREDGGAALVAKLISPVRSEAFILSPQGELRPLLSGARLVESAAWVGGRLLALSDLEREFVGLIEIDPDDLQRASLRLIDEAHDVIAFRPDPGGRRLAAVVNEGAYDSLRIIDLRSGQELGRSQLPDGLVYSDNASNPAQHVAWSHDGERLLVAWESATSPAEIVDAGTGERWTRAGGDPLPGLIAPQQIAYRSFDGLEVPALHYRTNSTPKPTVVLFHGGPEGQSRATFNGIIGMWNAAGFDVLAPNVRGSTGYGAGYDSLDDRDLRWNSVRDGCEAGRWLRANGAATQLIAMGGSYGGFMTLAVLVEDPSLWSAGIDIVGIADWHSFLRNTSGWRRSLRVAEYGEPEGPDGVFLAEFSPLRRSGAISAHLLVIHGRNDVRVPVGEARQIHEAVPGSELMIFDDEGHGIIRHPNRVRAYGRALSFVRERLDPAGAIA